jgi:prepilin-type N-terminal cleavage/methylation domain-containing protein
MTNRSKLNGFSLIELSIVILIISLISTAILALYNRKDISEKNTETKEKMEKISEAMKLYFKEHGYLPCPAPLNAGLASNQFSDNGTDGDSTCPRATTSSANLFAGTIPVATLGLPYQYMFDSWGNRIAYVIHKSLAETWGPATASTLLLKNKLGSYSNYRKPYATEIGANVTDCGGNNFPSVAWTDRLLDCPAILLISYGANGLFSYNIAGVGPRTSTFGKSNFEKDNTPVTTTSPAFDKVFSYMDLNQDTQNSIYTYYFDDIVVYKSMAYFSAN